MEPINRRLGGTTVISFLTKWGRSFVLFVLIEIIFKCKIKHMYWSYTFIGFSKIVTLMNYLRDFRIHTKSKSWKVTYLSNEMATSVKMLILTLKIWTVGQNWHMNAGRSQRCNRAAWNWKGMAKRAMVTSAKARLAMYIFVTVRIRLDTTTT